MGDVFHLGATRWADWGRGEYSRGGHRGGGVTECTGVTGNPL